MTTEAEQRRIKAIVKIVYFDEQSASDYLDITAGGKTAATSEQVRKRTTDTHAKVETSIAAKLSWLPFIGGSAEAGGGFEIARAGQSILSKTLSNTILTDYLAQVEGDNQIRRLAGLRVTASKDSMAYMKMFTPYMVVAKSDDLSIDLARLDEALASAKGYYELIGEKVEGGGKCVLRFNLQAFRNNYGLTDLLRMRLTYHGVHVGLTAEASLSMSAEMAGPVKPQATIAARDLLDGTPPEVEADVLDVFDILFAGVEHEG